MRRVAGFGGEGGLSKQADGALGGITEGISYILDEAEPLLAWASAA